MFMFQKILFIFIFFIALIYIISPIDLVPDIIPVVGWVDDVFAGLFGLFFLIKSFKM